MPARTKAFSDSTPGSAPVIVATAASNGLGFNAHQTWAFWRAQISPWSESPFTCENGERATLAHARTLPLRSYGADRLLALARDAWAELQPALTALPAGTKVGLHVGTPERLADRAFASQQRALEKGLSELVTPASFTLYPLGHAAFAYALQEAAAALATRTLDAVVVGGMDTYYDPPVIETLIAQERLFDQENTVAIIPGEGVAFVLVVRPDLARRAKLEALARLEAAATAQEPNPLLGETPSTAQGLSEVMRGITARLKAQRRQVEWILSDVTNEDHRTQEFMLAMPRALAPGGLDTAGKDYFQLAPSRFPMDFLPENFGDLGAASMATAVVIAAESFRRSVPAAKNCLVTGSSLPGQRGAVLISAPE